MKKSRKKFSGRTLNLGWPITCLYVVFLLGNLFFRTPSFAAASAETSPPPATKVPAPTQKTPAANVKTGVSLSGNTVDIYKNSCGQCHLAYPPEFLPAQSWERLLGETQNHFQESFSLEPEVKTLLSTHLRTHSAEQSDSKIARKILESLAGKIPQRLTEVPYLIKKHKKITPDILERPAIRSLSNCQACHQGAEKGEFSSMKVIPQ